MEQSIHERLTALELKVFGDTNTGAIHERLDSLESATDDNSETAEIVPEPPKAYGTYESQGLD